MRILIACEFSGTVRDAFRKVGGGQFDVWSCDLLPCVKPGNHYHGDVFDIISEHWDLLIAHPPCTYLSSSGLHWNKRIPGREELTKAALKFAVDLFSQKHIKRKVMENPRGRLGTAFRKADQKIQPNQFGHDASKETHLWIEGLPLLVATKHIPGRKVVLPSGNIVERWANQTDSGQNRLGPSEDRAMIRSTTYQGIADAFADQWGKLLFTV